MFKRYVRFLSLVCLCLLLGCGLRHRTRKVSTRPPDNNDTTFNKEIKEDHLDTGRMLFYKGDIRGAAKAFEIAVNESPMSFVRHYSLGLAYYRLRDYQMAIEEYKKAIQLKPNFAEAYYNLGVVYDQIGEFEEALDAYDMAIKYGLDDATVHFNKGVIFLKLCRFDEAKKENLLALGMKADFPEVYNNLGYIAEADNNVNNAIEMYKKSLELRPNYRLAKENLDRLQKGAGPKKAKRAEGGILNRFSLEFDGSWAFEKDIELDTSDSKEVGSENKKGIFRLGYDITRWLDIFVDFGITDIGFEDSKVFDNALGIQERFGEGGSEFIRYEGYEKVLGPMAGLGFNVDIYQIKPINLGFDTGFEFSMGLNEDKVKVGTYDYKATAEWMEYILSLRAKYLGFNRIVPYCGLLFDKLDGNFEVETNRKIRGNQTDIDYSGLDPFGVMLGSSYYFGKHIRLQTEARALNELSFALRMKYNF